MCSPQSFIWNELPRSRDCGVSIPLAVIISGRKKQGGHALLFMRFAGFMPVFIHPPHIPLYPPAGTLAHGTAYKPYVNKYREAERAFNLANDLMGISMAALYGAVLAARRWYTKTEWQRCLPEDDANRLLSCMVEQYPNGRR